jgi:anti-sigma regulatory factor (Ser/Thr protein kinase)
MKQVMDSVELNVSKSGSTLVLKKQKKRRAAKG